MINDLWFIISYLKLTWIGRQKIQISATDFKNPLQHEPEIIIFHRLSEIELEKPDHLWQIQSLQTVKLEEAVDQILELFFERWPVALAFEDVWVLVEIGMGQHLLKSKRRESSEISDWVLLGQ